MSRLKNLIRDLRGNKLLGNLINEATRKRSLVLEEFDREQAIASLDKGQAVIPIWLDEIHQKLITV